MADDFDDLLAEFTTMHKSMPVAEEAAGEEESTAAADGGGEGEGAGADEGGADGLVSKSLKLENGEEVDYLDGTELVKSLTARADAQDTKIAALEGQLAKSLQALGLSATMMKSMSATITRLGNAPAGRRSVVSIQAKEAGAAAVASPSAADPLAGMTADAVLNKSMALYQAGQLGAADVNRIEAHINSGMGVPAVYHSKIFAAAAGA